MSQVIKLEKHLRNVKKEVTEFQDCVNNTQEIHEKLMELEEGSQINKLQFEVIEETQNETW